MLLRSGPGTYRRKPVDAAGTEEGRELVDRAGYDASLISDAPPPGSLGNGQVWEPEAGSASLRSFKVPIRRARGHMPLVHVTSLAQAYVFDCSPVVVAMCL